MFKRTLSYEALLYPFKGFKCNYSLLRSKCRSIPERHPLLVMLSAAVPPFSLSSPSSLHLAGFPPHLWNSWTAYCIQHKRAELLWRGDKIKL